MTDNIDRRYRTDGPLEIAVQRSPDYAARLAAFEKVCERLAEALEHMKIGIGKRRRPSCKCCGKKLRAESWSIACDDPLQYKPGAKDELDRTIVAWLRKPVRMFETQWRVSAWTGGFGMYGENQFCNGGCAQTWARRHGGAPWYREDRP